MISHLGIDFSFMVLALTILEAEILRKISYKYSSRIRESRRQRLAREEGRVKE